MNPDAPETSPEAIIHDADPAAKLRELTRKAMTSMENRRTVLGVMQKVVSRASAISATLIEAQARIQLGNLLVMAPQEAGEGMKHYAAAVELLRPLANAGEDDARVEQAGALANQAQVLQRVAEGKGLPGALAAVNSAIQVISQTSWRTIPRFAHNLAAFHIHQGNILASLRKGEESLKAFEQAVEIGLLLEDLGDARWRDICGSAWLNRGMVLAGLGSQDTGVQALISFEAAVAAFSTGEDALPSPTLAAALTNRANVLAYATPEIPAAKEAMDNAVRALRIVSSHARTNRSAAETTLKAIWALCGGASKIISLLPGRRYQSPLAQQVSDHVDEAMSLLRHWEKLGAPFPSLMATEFFRYGANLYCWMDPNFFIEFVRELLPEGEAPAARFAPACIPIALQVLEERAPDLEKNHWVIDGDVRSERLLRDHSRLLAERERLLALAEEHKAVLTPRPSAVSS